MGSGEEGHPRGWLGWGTPSEPRKRRKALDAAQKKHDAAVFEFFAQHGGKIAAAAVVAAVGVYAAS